MADSNASFRIAGAKVGDGDAPDYAVLFAVEDLQPIELGDQTFIGQALTPDEAEELGLSLIRTAAIMRQMQAKTAQL